MQDIGRVAVQHPDAKPYTHDLLLSMALAEVSHISKEVRIMYHPFGVSIVMPPFLTLGAFLKCATAKIGFEKNKVSQGFEALARAQCLLRSRKSLGKIALLSQVILSHSMCFSVSFFCLFNGIIFGIYTTILNQTLRS